MQKQTERKYSTVGIAVLCINACVRTFDHHHPTKEGAQLKQPTT